MRFLFEILSISGACLLVQTAYASHGQRYCAGEVPLVGYDWVCSRDYHVSLISDKKSVVNLPINPVTLKCDERAGPATLTLNSSSGLKMGKLKSITLYGEGSGKCEVYTQMRKNAQNSGKMLPAEIHRRLYAIPEYPYDDLTTAVAPKAPLVKMCLVTAIVQVDYGIYVSFTMPPDWSLGLTGEDAKFCK